nr:sugar transferase [Bacillus sp. FJAT-44742]
MKKLRQTERELILSKSIYYKVIKRTFDIFISSLGLIILSPLFILVSIIILLFDGRPVLFKQPRSGKNNTVFSMYKFRSMKQVNRPERSEEIRFNWKEKVPDNFVFKTSTSNPNITKVGYYLRKYSVDELPQLFNVLIGNMSIIGPRPEIPEITACYDYHQSQRLKVKPGITGYAQINGRSEIPHGVKIEYDLYYVRNCSILLDSKIFLKTITQIITGKGAY